MAPAATATTRTACGRSPQATAAKGGLSPARSSRIRPNAIIRPMTIFGSMPAPGEASVPNGKSPLTARMSAPATTNAPPATWSLRRVMGCPRLPVDRGRLSVSHLADLVHGVFHACRVGIPEGLELGLIEIGDVLAEILHGL